MNFNLTASLPFLDDYEDAFTNMVGAKQNWLSAIRRRGFQAYANQGVNFDKVENWHYTKLRFLEKTNFVKSETKAEINLPKIDNLNTGYVAVLVNGKFRPELSQGELPKGLKVYSLESILEKDTPTWILEMLARQVDIQKASFAALNTAWLEDGFVIEALPNVSFKKPILILSLYSSKSQPRISHVRGLIKLGKNANIKVIEEHHNLSETACFSNAVTEVYLNEDAKLGYYKMLNDNKSSYHIGFVGGKVLKNGNFESFVMQKDALLSRCEYNMDLTEEYAKAVVNGVYMGAEKQHLDITNFVEHSASNTFSDQFIRGLTTADSKAVFQGKILVKHGIAKIDANQSHKALLLSENSEVDCKPELEIYADDVKCSHGATTGFLDKDAMFYLRARGISESLAKKLLATAFLKEAINTISDENIVEYFEKNLEQWLDENPL